MLKFQEQLLSKTLAGLSPAARVAFAASCAQRLANAYRYFFETKDCPEQIEICDNALDYAWSHILQDSDTQAIDRILSIILAMVPDQDAPDWTPSMAYAEDALSAIAYCLNCLQSANPQESAWAARRVYEALDTFVTQRDNISPSEPGAEARILRDGIIQIELQRQARDVEYLGLAGKNLTQEFLDRLRRRSVKEQAIPM